MSDIATPPAGAPDSMLAPPLEVIGGRYRMLRELGRGGFGRVLLAEDDLLKRRVAVKLLRKSSRGGAAGFLADAAFLAEARMVAKMEHAHIVPIYDVTETDEGEYCIVSRYVEGMTLREHLLERRFAYNETAGIVIRLCEALHHAHKIGVVHRDVKPANVMISTEGLPMLLDFGLARNWSEAVSDGLAAGTPGYMSPEQARGEDHLINGRSDIFSLGAVLYEMLTGKRAFLAGSVQEMLRLLASGGPSPLRQVSSAVPKELERICLKALNPQIRLRYPIALDMADDLRAWSSAMADTVVGGPRAAAATAPAPGTARPAAQSPEILTGPPRVVPRGLRAFDEGDSDFFLTLIPGPRDRFGLPESLRFWKQRIESDDPQLAFRVGVLYGPSGCGKSSLMRAGLLPRCADHVTVLYHESRDTGNAARLGRALHLKFPQLDLSDSTPAVLIQKLRHGGHMRDGQKLLIVIDQSEQWLRAGDQPGSEEGAALLNTLRQCDGTHVQVLLLIRDDFWRGVSHLFADADVELNSNNSALVDLFEPRHAEKVLEAFGRAYRCLPEDHATPLPRPARDFIQQATRSLEQSRRISPVKLALFADMFRTREWTVESLRSVGGVGGVAITFLEESFRGPTARAPLRLHERAARQVLQLFVPESGDVRGPACPQSDMLKASGYDERPKEFQELLHVLDADLRLLTPVDTLETSDGKPSWQLTHDYMVPALRDWLLARKADTVRGRAEIALGERAREWHQRPDSARLPSVWEWGRLRVLTRPYRWSPVEKQWMRGGMKRARLWSVVCVLAILAGWFVLHETQGRERGHELARRVLAASTGQVRDTFKDGAAWKRWAEPALIEAARQPPTTANGLNSRLALVTDDGAYVPELAEVMLNADAPTFRAICKALGNRSDVPLAFFRHALGDGDAGHGRKLRAFVALTTLDPGESVLNDMKPDMARWLLAFEAHPAEWAALLRPASRRLSPSFESIMATAGNETEKLNAALALASLHAEDPTELVRLLALVPVTSVSTFSRELYRHDSSRDLLANAQPPDMVRNWRPTLALLSETEEAAYAGYANTLLAKLSTGLDESFWPHLSRGANRTLRTFLVVRAAIAGVPADILATRVTKEGDVGVRQALLAALSFYPLSALSVPNQEALMLWLRQAYIEDKDGGVHSMIATLMRRWGLSAELQRWSNALPRSPVPNMEMGWWITPRGRDMRVMTRPDGSWYAMASCEVTVAEYQEFASLPELQAVQREPGDQVPVTGMGRGMAGQFADWLSVWEGLGQNACVYGDGEMERAGALQRTGYRLPTRAEWQVAASSATGFRWDFGNAASLLVHFAWCEPNSGGRMRSVGGLLPNEQGLWDVLGNAAEWGHDQSEVQQVKMGEFYGGAAGSLIRQLDASEIFKSGWTTSRPETGIRLTRSLPTTVSQK